MNRVDLRVEPGDRSPAEIGTGRFWRHEDRRLDLILFEDPSNLILSNQFVVQALFPSDIVVLEINGLQPGIGPLELFTFLKSVEKILFRYPIDAIDATHEVHFEIIENSLPLLQ